MKFASASSLGVALIPLLAATYAPAQDGMLQPIVRYDTRHEVSLPLRDLARIANRSRISVAMPEPAHSVRLAERPRVEDTVLQQFYLPAVHTEKVLSFDAIRMDETFSFVPDTNGAVGSSQFVEITNYSYAVYDKKTGKVILSPTETDTLFLFSKGLCRNTPPGDPLVIWDKLANRWLVSYFNYQGNDALCVAVSTSDDATGSYNLYEYDYGSTLPDYPKYAVWPDAYYSNINVSSAQAQPCAYDRNAMLAGKKAAAICFTPSGTFGLLPSDLDGSTPPPQGAPNHYLQLDSSGDALDEYDFHADFAHPKKSTFSGPNTISVAAFNEACGGFGNCIPQPDSGEEVEGLGDRLMFRLTYRNFGDHEAMVAAHSVAPDASSNAVSAMRWYELRATPVGSAFALYQSGTFQNKKVSLWMGSAAMDKQGNIALGMSASSDVKDPSVWYTGRLASDPLGKMEAPTIAAKGTSIESGDEDRWGDYSSMSIDPSDDCTFWYSQMYYNKKHGGSASGDWDTRVSAFKFDDCK